MLGGPSTCLWLLHGQDDVNFVQTRESSAADLTRLQSKARMLIASPSLFFLCVMYIAYYTYDECVYMCAHMCVSEGSCLHRTYMESRQLQVSTLTFHLV